MNSEITFACIRNDTGLVSEILHVSPVFVRCGPSSRGSYAERRLARARRTDARHARKTVQLFRDIEPAYERCVKAC